jgi:cold shock CspA family protein
MSGFREQGRISVFWPARAYGYLARSGAPRIFFHGSELPPDFEYLRPGTKVEFTVSVDERGRPKAVNLEVVQMPAATRAERVER